MVKVDAALFLLGLPLVKAVALYLHCRWSICLLAYLPTYIPAYLTTYQPPHTHAQTFKTPGVSKRLGGLEKGGGVSKTYVFETPLFLKSVA